jgi:DNA-binding XRE family transcriptional regulator
MGNQTDSERGGALSAETRSDAVAIRTRLGERLLEARHGAGMSQKELASRLGISLWSVDQFERGKPGPPIRVADIAAATNVPTASLVQPASEIMARAQHPAEPSTTVAQSTHSRVHHLVLGCFALLVLVRFFTEVVPVVPRAANFIDIPILVTLVAAAIATTRRPHPIGDSYLPLAGPILVFLLICSASAALNPSRVAIGPALVFIYGILAPLGVYAAVYRLWPAGTAASMIRLLLTLGIIQLAVVIVVDLPRFIATGDPDEISGTFGTNQYQFVFFLLLFTTLVAGVFTFEPRRMISRFAPVLTLAALTAIFLAQYRSLLLTTVVSMLLVAALLTRRRRGLISAIVVLAALVAALAYVASAFPGLRLGTTVATYRSEPLYYASERLKVAGSVIDVYSEEPAAIATGTGPGTYSSRGWQTFALVNSRSRANVAGPYASIVSGGAVYRTDVSDKYVLPRYSGGTLVEGSGQLSSPLFEYASLLAEVGVLGFLVIVGIYVAATLRLLRQTGRLVREATPGDPLPALFLTSAVAFTALLQMGFLDNWLEVTRVTFVSWMLLAVAHKELDSRSVSG